MAREKPKIILVHATTETKINTENCLITTSTRDDHKDDVGSDDSEKITDDDDKSEDNQDTGADIMKKDEKKRKKRKKKKEKTNDTSNEAPRIVTHTNVKLEPIVKPEPKPAPKADNPNRNIGGCFGFISSWIAKKLEKRRRKKRKAIRERSSKIKKTKLKVYDHKKSRGGEAFTLEFDSPKIRISVLPAFKLKPGLIKLNYDRKLVKAEMKRKEHLARKLDFINTQEERRFETMERKLDNESGFRQMAALTIMAKQGQAMKNKSIIQMYIYRRCASFTSRAKNIIPREVPVSSEDDDVARDNNFLE